MKILLLADHAEPRLWEELDRRKLEDVELEEAKLDVEALVEEAFQGVQRITVG